ncbi:MAG: MFS transporter [Pseudolabrys sp.]|nr:MFS transporter [Pseudolabrys sp.]
MPDIALKASRFVNATQRRTFWSACVAHALHDGYSDSIYVLLPIWQSEFGLSYGVLALLRGLYSGGMALFQVPVGWVAGPSRGPMILGIGTALSATGYVLAGLSGGLIGLGIALAVGGVGASTQHPLASAAVSYAFEARSRGPLGIYNFAGDVGKASLPVLTSLLLALASWRVSVWMLAVLGFFVAAGILLVMPRFVGERSTTSAKGLQARGRGGFITLLMIGVLDSGVRMGFLLFLPFLLQDKGASLPMVGPALAVVFLGGAAGKFMCGWLGERLGVLSTVLLTELGTAGGIAVVIVAPLWGCFAVLPLVGVMLNGTSSVLYGTVPELVSRGSMERAFAIFYTGTIGSGALSPLAFGLLGDAAGARMATAATAATALLTIPLALVLAPHLTKTKASAFS